MGGYPDQGEGRYSEKLPYDRWHKFNNAQRAHNNSMEMLPVFLASILVCGLVYPKLSAIAGPLIFIGRVMYVQGYNAKGPTGREKGAILSLLISVAMLFLTFGTTVHLIYKNGV